MQEDEDEVRQKKRLFLLTVGDGSRETSSVN